MGADQLLKIEPEHELKFKGPFTSSTTSFLKLVNPTDKRICFKIKTTAPKRYCVRPNAGILDPGSHLSIAVVLQPFDLDPTANKHKFMVQAIFAPEGDVNQDELWKNTSSSNVMETKLRCTFEIPSEATNEQSLHAAQEEKFTRAPKDKPDYEAAVKSPRSSNPPLVEEELTAEDRIKQENMQLKDEVERLRRKLKNRGGEAMMQSSMSQSPQSQSMLFVVVAIVMLMAGLLAGKFAL